MIVKRVGVSPVTILLVVVISAVLLTVTFLGATQQLGKNKDVALAKKAEAVSAALEAYHSSHGHYPSARAIVNTYDENTGEGVARLLNIDERHISSTNRSLSNIITAPGSNESGFLYYWAESTLHNDECQHSTSGACDKFTLQFVMNDGSRISLKSNRGPMQSFFIANAPERPFATTGDGLVHNTVEISSTITSCILRGERLTPNYSFRTKTEGKQWSNWSQWSPSPTFTTGATPGVPLHSMVKTRCNKGSDEGAPSKPSPVDTFTPHQRSLSTPTLLTTTNSDSITTRVSGLQCEANSTPEYAFRSRVNAGEWSHYSDWSTTDEHTITTNEGSYYSLQARARCLVHGSKNTSPNYATTPVASSVRVISSTPSIVATSSTTHSFTTWNVNAPPCSTDTAPQFRYSSQSDTGFTTDWSSPSLSSHNPAWDTSREGHTYTRTFQVRCISAYEIGPWSQPVASHYARTVTTPPAPSHMNYETHQHRGSTSVTFQADNCRPGAIREFQTIVTEGANAATFEGAPIHRSNQSRVTIKAKPGTTLDENMTAYARYRCVNPATGVTSEWGPIVNGGTIGASRA